MFQECPMQWFRDGSLGADRLFLNSKYNVKIIYTYILPWKTSVFQKQSVCYIQNTTHNTTSQSDGGQSINSPICMDVTPIDRLEGKGCRCEAGRREWGQGVDEYPIHASIYMYTYWWCPCMQKE